MKKLWRALLAPTLVVGALSLSNHARAWEVDVHYGLTKWLALQAGYTIDQAEWVATGDQGIDDSTPRNPLFATIVGACVGFKDTGASALVRQDHFASRQGPPNIPQVRIVEPGRVFGDSGEVRVPKVVGDKPTMQALGRYLHALQDTWSHQGQPDIPWTCDDDYGWGHAVARGGWLCHIADQTYRWHDTDVPKMARRTYEVLQRAWKRPNAKKWSEIEAKVKAFARLQSKRAKDAWFRAENFDRRDFVLATSLPDCDPDERPCTPMSYEPRIERWQRLRANAQAATPASIPDDFRALYARFFENLVEQRDETLRFEVLNMAAVAASYAKGSHIKELCPDLYPKVHKLMLGPGFMDGKGAQQPRELCERVSSWGRTKRAELSCADALKAADDAINGAQIRGPGFDKVAPELPRAQKYFYTIAAGRTSQTYVALARFIHLPRDILVVGAEKKDNRAQVTSVFWMPNE